MINHYKIIINPYKIIINHYKIIINPYKIIINPYKIIINPYKIIINQYNIIINPYKIMINPRKKTPTESGHSSLRRALRQLRQLRWILLAASSSRRRSARSQSQGQVWHGLAPWEINGKSMGNQWEIHGKSMGNQWEIYTAWWFLHVLTILKNDFVSSQLGVWYSHILRKINNVWNWNHQPVQENSGHMGLQTGFMMVGFGFELWIFTSFSWMKPGDKGFLQLFLSTIYGGVWYFWGI